MGVSTWFILYQSAKLIAAGGAPAMFVDAHEKDFRWLMYAF